MINKIRQCTLTLSIYNYNMIEEKNKGLNQWLGYDNLKILYLIEQVL